MTNVAHAGRQGRRVTLGLYSAAKLNDVEQTVKKALLGIGVRARFAQIKPIVRPNPLGCLNERRRARAENRQPVLRRTHIKPLDAGAVSAKFDRGVLEVRIPKPEQRKPTRVQIGTGPVEGTADQP